MSRYQVTISIVQVGSKELGRVELPNIDQAHVWDALRGALTISRRDDTTSRFSTGSAGFFAGGKVEL